jgi:hypothetical protein
VRAARLAAGLVLLALAGWLLKALVVPAEPPAPARAFESSSQCADCHAQVYEEWSGSQHAMSWTNPAVRDLSNDFANTDCIDCHAPRPVFETGIGNRVLPRAARRVEGVDCIACHQMSAEGGGVHMAGTLTDPSAACRPVEVRELTRPDFCAGCHDQHETVKQWAASEWPDRGMDCLACHMPERPDGSGRDHTMHGGTSLANLEKAVELRGVRAGSGWTIELENVGAGHSFPTDERSRAADVFWRPAGEETWRHLHRMRSPYRHEVDVPDTLLAAHELRLLPLEDPEADGPVEVALFYKRSPYWEDPDAPDPDREATRVHLVELAP